MRNKWSVLGLGMLALVTAVLVVLAFVHVRPKAVVAEPAAALTERSVTEPTPRSTPSPREPRTSSIAEISELLGSGEPVRVVVVGDATGEDDATQGTQRWVTRWADGLAQERAVELRAMGDDGEYADAQRLGAGDNPIEIRNASGRPALLSEVITDSERLIPADTDIVVLNFGHRESARSLADDLTNLQERLPQGSMALVVLQNSQRGGGSRAHVTRVDVVRAWSYEAGLPRLDVFGAFLDDPRPLVELLGPNLVIPNDAGATLWAETMLDTLSSEPAATPRGGVSAASPSPGGTATSTPR